ncbi:MAG: 7-cyano-7-deazaguanine synthase, partial [Eubacteriales bacterium]|nr:7-cyano-7-deazaguanine synthase [Eubacteriales bacterium]
MTLSDFFREYPRAALAFSGGVDSAYLLYEAVQRQADIRPYFIKTDFQPAFELADARRLAKELGVELTVIEYDILDNPLIRANPADRCYYCKRTLFSRLRQAAIDD